MAKVSEFLDESGTHKGWLIECPACGNSHWFDARWTFNGDMEKPTFWPSLVVTVKFPPKPGPNGQPIDGTTRCHSWVTDGKIQYLADCTHAMAGQTVELPEI